MKSVIDAADAAMLIVLCGMLVANLIYLFTKLL